MEPKIAKSDLTISSSGGMGKIQMPYDYFKVSSNSSLSDYAIVADAPLKPKTQTKKSTKHLNREQRELGRMLSPDKIVTESLVVNDLFD